VPTGINRHTWVVPKDVIAWVALIVLFPGSYLAGWVKGYKSGPPFAVAKAMLRPAPTVKDYEKEKILKGFDERSEICRRSQRRTRRYCTLFGAFVVNS